MNKIVLTRNGFLLTDFLQTETNKLLVSAKSALVIVAQIIPFDLSLTLSTRQSQMPTFFRSSLLVLDKRQPEIGLFSQARSYWEKEKCELEIYG